MLTQEENGVGYVHLLRNSGFRSLWLGQLFSQVAASTMLFVLALRMYQATGSNAAVSGLFLVYGIPAVIFGMVAGTIVDKLDKRQVLIYCDLGRAALTLGLVFFSGNAPVIYLYTFFAALINQFYVPAEAPTIPFLVRPNELVTANSLFSFTYFSSLAVGSVFAGPLTKLFGPTGVLVFIAGLFAVAAGIVFRLPHIGEKVHGWGYFGQFSPGYLVGRIGVNLRAGVGYVSRSPVLRDSLLLLTGTQVILAILGTLGPGFADRVLEIDVRDASLLITGPVVLGILVGAVWIGNFAKAVRSQKLINLGVLGIGLTLFLIAVVVRLERMPNLIWLFAPGLVLPLVLTLFFVLGISNSLLDVPANSILQEEAGGEMRSRVYGMLTAAVGGVGTLPVILGGILADTMGPGKVVLLLGICVAIYGVWRLKYNGMNK